MSTIVGLGVAKGDNVADGSRRLAGAEVERLFEAAGQLDIEDEIFAVVCRPRLDEVGGVDFVVLAHVAKASGTSASVSPMMTCDVAQAAKQIPLQESKMPFDHPAERLCCQAVGNASNGERWL